MRTISKERPRLGRLDGVIISESNFVAYLGHMLFPVGRVHLSPEGVEEGVLGK